VKINILTKALVTSLLLASSAVMAANDYPASDFKPKVLFSDSSAASPAKSAPATPPDPNFPAATFQPKVLFNDTDYKHSSAPPKAASSGSSAATAGSSSGGGADTGSEPASSGSNNNHLIGLAALAAVGFLLYKNKAGVKSVSGSSAQQASGGATGVEKYLEKQGINKTGVAKYLEKQGANPATGVAKYVAKQKIKDKETAATKVTGVEKYLREKV
jgi:hypothetical protein